MCSVHLIKMQFEIQKIFIQHNMIKYASNDKGMSNN